MSDGGTPASEATRAAMFASVSSILPGSPPAENCPIMGCPCPSLSGMLSNWMSDAGSVTTSAREPSTVSTTLMPAGCRLTTYRCGQLASRNVCTTI